MNSTNQLRIGVPSKGRLSELATELLLQAGLNFRRQDRSLFARVSSFPADITFLRTDDIPTLCSEGAIDLGITGSDLVEEAGVNVDVRMKLGVGRCRLSMCVPIQSAIHSPVDLRGKRVATSFPNTTRRFLEQHDVQVENSGLTTVGKSADSSPTHPHSNGPVHLVNLNGSVEIMISLGVADAIVDLVETGSTLAANNLRILTDIGSYETVLIQSPTCRDPVTADRIVRRLEGVVIARDYSLLEYNISADKLEEAESVTPGFTSPTKSPLEEAGWFAVRAMVKSKDVIGIMEKLESLGAKAILEMTINNCRL